MLIFAKYISYVFHPVIFFLFTPSIIIYRQTLDIFYSLKWSLFSFAFIIFGIVMVLLGKWQGIFTDEDVTQKNERYKLYFILSGIAIPYFAIVLFFKGLTFPLTIVSAGIILGLFLFAAANYFFKISIHTAIATAFVLTLGFLYGLNTFLFVFWIAPLTAWARIVTKRHTFIEAISGGLLSFFITTITYIVVKYLLHNYGS